MLPIPERNSVDPQDSCRCALSRLQGTESGKARFEHYAGRSAVAAHLAPLESLAARSGQPGAAHGLAFMLQEEFAARKIPHLVLVYSAHTPAQDHLLGAVLFFEYRLLGFATGCFATGDSFGVRTVFAPNELRALVAAQACKALLAEKAALVLASFKLRGASPRVPEASANVLWAIGHRTVQDSLLLAETWDATLRALGKKTRTNLRAQRRKFEATIEYQFVPMVDTQPFWDDELLVRLNSRSRDPVPQATFNLRLRAMGELSGGFISGLRSASGEWLALAGGWRQGSTTWIEWQVNATGWQKLSLTTVLRSFVIEEEIARATKRLGFHGGTSHTMSHSFETEQVVDMLARRPGVVTWMITALATVLFSRFAKLQRRGNFLGDALGRRPCWKST